MNGKLPPFPYYSLLTVELLLVLMIAGEDVDKYIRFWHQEKWYDLPVKLYIEYIKP